MFEWIDKYAEVPVSPWLFPILLIPFVWLRLIELKMNKLKIKGE